MWGQELGAPGSQACQNLELAEQPWGRGWGRGGRGGAMLTSGVPADYPPASRCLHSRCKGLRPRNLPAHSFCPGCRGHSRASRRRSEVRTHPCRQRRGHADTDIHSQVRHTQAEARALPDTPEHGFGPVGTAPEAISPEDRQNRGQNECSCWSLPSASSFQSSLSPSRAWGTSAGPGPEGPPGWVPY